MINHTFVFGIPRDLDLAMINEAFHIFGMISNTFARIHDTLQIRNPL